MSSTRHLESNTDPDFPRMDQPCSQKCGPQAADTKTPQPSHTSHKKNKATKMDLYIVCIFLLHKFDGSVFFLALTWLEMMMSLAPWLLYDGPSAFRCLSVKQIGDRMIICHSKYLFVQVPTAMEMILVQLWGDKSLESRLYYFHCEPRLRAGRPMAGPNL